jgi:hypothetical protein
LVARKCQFVTMARIVVVTNLFAMRLLAIHENLV